MTRRKPSRVPLLMRWVNWMARRALDRMSDQAAMRLLHDRLEALIRQHGDHETNRIPLVLTGEEAAQLLATVKRNPLLPPHDDGGIYGQPY